jgi:galactokinase
VPSFRAPGRVNLIGDHTDYNDGFVLPVAVDLDCVIHATPRDDAVVNVAWLDGGAGSDRYANAVRAVLAEYGRADVGIDAEVSSTIPVGSGLSSSAALEVALALALLSHSDQLEPDRSDLAKLCSRVENDWVGAQTGLLDQLAALLSEPGHALRIDFRSLEVRPVPLDLGDWRLVTVDSGATHSIAASGYNQRRAECEAACAQLGIETLREAREEELPRLEGTLRRRARHVITEDGRVDAMAERLAAHDLEAAGALLDASHASLRDDYEASVPEVERTVAALKRAGAAGARMVGGGFGGSVLALFAPGDAWLPDGCVSVAPGPAARRL